MENESNEVDDGGAAARLNLIEARVLGCLMEKEATTPDIYPLSLNALVNGCNQKSNRAPVLNLDEDEVGAALDGLRAKHLATAFSGANARAIKYRHRFGDVFPVEPLARAMVAELMLRGPQTTAGLRGNCERLIAVPDGAECEAVLGDLAGKIEPLVRKLARQPGQKEARWAQLLIDADGGESGGREPLRVAVTLPPQFEQRITVLETGMTELREELARLRSALGE
jgi:hypothetical protein